MQGFDLTKPGSIQGKQPENCSIVMPIARCSLYDIIGTTVEKVSTTACQAPIQRPCCLPQNGAQQLLVPAFSLRTNGQIKLWPLFESLARVVRESLTPQIDCNEVAKSTTCTLQALNWRVLLVTVLSCTARLLPKQTMR